MQHENRVTHFTLNFQKLTVREIAPTCERAHSTITREPDRDIRDGKYASKSAEICTFKRLIQIRPVLKLHKERVLFGTVQHLLYTRWSHE